MSKGFARRGTNGEVSVKSEMYIVSITASNTVNSWAPRETKVNKEPVSFRRQDLWCFKKPWLSRKGHFRKRLKWRSWNLWRTAHLNAKDGTKYKKNRTILVIFEMVPAGNPSSISFCRSLIRVTNFIAHVSFNLICPPCSSRRPGAFSII